MSTKTEIVVYRASYRKVFSASFRRMSFSTATRFCVNQPSSKVNLDRRPVRCLPLAMRFLPLFLALACLGVLAALDVVVRLRLRKIGEQSRPFQGGIFNHAKYLRLRKQYHWSGWPVYLIWTVWLASIVFMLLNLLYNTVPRHTGL